MAAAYDRGAQAYARSWTSPHPWMGQARGKFAQRVPAGMSLLDVGCGPGHDSNYWSAKGLKTVGIDISAGAIAIARELYPALDFRVMDVFDVARLRRRFDAVWMAYALLHVSRAAARQAIRAMADALKRRGVLFVETSVADSTHETIRTIAGLTDASGAEIEAPYTSWSPNDLIELLGREFEVEWSKIYCPLPDRPKLWSGIMRRR